MGRVRKHYVLEVSREKVLDRWIIAKLIAWCSYLSTHGPTAYDRATVAGQMREIQLAPWGWRKRLLALWAIVKPHTARGREFSGATLTEFHHRSGSALGASAYARESRRCRGGLRAKPRGGVNGLDNNPPAGVANGIRQYMINPRRPQRPPPFVDQLAEYNALDAPFLRPPPPPPEPAPPQQPVATWRVPPGLFFDPR